MASWRHEAARKAVRQGLQRPPKIVHRPNHDPEQLTPAQTQTAVNLLHQLLSHKPDGVFTLDKAERREIASSVGKSVWEHNTTHLKPNQSARLMAQAEAKPQVQDERAGRE